ncbi:DesA family fatty acid desaturase [Comamonas endophytica]|uniref:Fatty acid desaturase n=1 Tax=Comamonas endophytica TaxID=2949090 RepID=A0ABY6GCA3_9BURK|nr:MULTISPECIES: fatty acid desaturase [unclassified Acidovorax]MCD2513113.1 fatty acid desaturase [Acidovorax sp. D4N7]UYG52548.1 fatty acid desaturase [Acidovorax sp. 5MLIR]
MWNFDGAFWRALLEWLGHGLWPLTWWQLVLLALATTHLTIISVTVFLHRCQSHRALELGPVPSHFFRFWLWLTTGMVTREWVAVHRKHHAKCESPEDPHSPQQRGLRQVLWQGAELYRRESASAQTLRSYGQGTPDDWLERRLYSRYPGLGIALLLVLELLLFGFAGLALWAVQMAWIPFWAAGVVNGVGHYWGYRNFEVQDASRNILPWGLLIGGEELHNNHHTYPTAARFSVRRHEFDVGWLYIRLLQRLGWARVRKTPPRWREGAPRAEADEATLEALITHRYEAMARYARGLRAACRAEVQGLKARQAHRDEVSRLRQVRRWLVRDQERLPQHARAELAQVCAAHPVLDQMLTMREELRQLWLNTSHTREQLTAELRAWCRKAEASNIRMLQEFSLALRAVQR